MSAQKPVNKKAPKKTSLTVSAASLAECFSPKNSKEVSASSLPQLTRAGIKKDA